MPVRQDGQATVYLSDVAQVHDGFPPQTSMVHVDGRRSAMLSVQKTANASTLDIVQRVRDALPRIQATLPTDLQITPLFDQSVFVRAALNGVLREALIAAGLTGLMILLFLGSWRSTLVILVSIPLAILCSVIVFSLMGQTLNTMTLGGLALAVGILVDDATVEIENTNRNLGMGKPVTRAILDGAQQIATPAFVSTLCICIVFVPVVFITGVARYLFTPLALAVVLAMLASYFLSRTVVPTMVQYLLPAEAHLHQPGHEVKDGGWIWSMHHRFNRHFERFQGVYRGALEWSLGHRWAVVVGFVVLVVVSLGIFPLLGMDFFPTVDAGQFRLHVRCPAGTRIEETEQRYAEVEQVIRETIPADEVQIIIDNIGIPGGGINLAFSDASIVSAADGEILVSLNPEHHGSTPGYVAQLRDILRERFPDLVFFFQPADMVTQILNFGLPAPIDVQIIGRDPKNQEIAQRPGASHRRHSRRRRRPPPAGGRRAYHQRRRGPPARPPARLHGAGRRLEPAGVTVGNRADCSQLLAQPAERGELCRRRPDAPVSCRLDGCAQQHADRSVPASRSPSCSPTSPPRERHGATERHQPLQRPAGARRAGRRAGRRPVVGREPRWTRSSPRSRRRCRAAPSSRSAARPNPCDRASRRWRMACSSPSCWSTC